MLTRSSDQKLAAVANALRPQPPGARRGRLEEAARGSQNLVWAGSGPPPCRAGGCTWRAPARSHPRPGLLAPVRLARLRRGCRRGSRCCRCASTAGPKICVFRGAASTCQILPSSIALRGCVGRSASGRLLSPCRKWQRRSKQSKWTTCFVPRRGGGPFARAESASACSRSLDLGFGLQFYSYNNTNNGSLPCKNLETGGLAGKYVRQRIIEENLAA